MRTTTRLIANLIAWITLVSASTGVVSGQVGPIPGINTQTPYLIYYGDWDGQKVAAARDQYAVVVLHPGSNVTAVDVAGIQAGTDTVAGSSDDVLVLGYVSLGEDDRTAAPLAGDGSGPRVDPRASSDAPLTEVVDGGMLGDPSPGGTEFASYYLDRDADGQPDTNSTFGAPFVNAGDPTWFDAIKAMTIADSGMAGLDEVMGNAGKGLGCDGAFLDTLDTAAPDSFGGYEWTAPGMQALIKRINESYPNNVLMANRGVFFFNPNLKTYAYSPRPYIQMLLFESYYTDISDEHEVTPFFADNKFNYAPKLNAEAGRPDGFNIFALGYDHPANLPAAIVDQDFEECMEIQGWPLYRTNISLDTPFSTAAAQWVQENPDNDAPIWGSTAAAGSQEAAPRVGLQELEAGDGSVTLRWDVAHDQTGPVTYNVYYTDEFELDFDTAILLEAVETSIPENYLAGAGAGRYPFEFTVDGLDNDLEYQFAVRAQDGVDDSNEDTNEVILFTVPQPPASSNLASISVDGDFSDWDGIDSSITDDEENGDIDYKDVWVANDDSYLYVRFSLYEDGAPFTTFNTHVFIDTDDNPASGLPSPGGADIGSEFMIESGAGFDQRGGGFNEGGVSAVGWQLSPDPFVATASEFELRISLSAKYGDGTRVFRQNEIRLILHDNRGDEISGTKVRYRIAGDLPEDVAPPVDPGAAGVYSTSIELNGDTTDWRGIPARGSRQSGGEAIDYKDVFLANDDDNLYVRFTLHSAALPFSSFNTHLFLDTDSNDATGFQVQGISFGSEMMVESGSGFDQRGGEFNEGDVSGLGWEMVPEEEGLDFEFKIPRSLKYSDGSPIFSQNRFDLLLQDNRGDSVLAVSYTFAAAPPGPVFATIVPDGDFTDWDGIAPQAVRASTGDAIDFQSLWLANDDQALYIRFALHSEGEPFSTFNTHVLIDSDDDSATGYQVSGADPSFGSEMMIESGAGFDQRNGEFNEGELGAVPWELSPVGAATEFELRIPRDLAYADGSPVFQGETFKVLLQDNRGAAPLASPYGFASAVVPLEIIEIIRNSDGTLSITFSSTVDATYTVESSADLVVWLEADDGISGGADGVKTIVLPAAVSGSLYYRVQEE
ncbi:MAG: hypothetical protein ACI9R3_001336 [Verrucomicrobiales bacterium]|jgi:hypothetical protein